MNHDPLCGLAQPCDEEEPEHGYCSMQHGLFCIHCHQWCICNVIAKVREEEQSKDLDYAYVAAQAEADGQRDMLAKCIAAVEYLHDHEAPHDAHRDALWNVLTALRALQEKP